MDLLALLDHKIQQFITQHIGSDIAKMALSKNPFPQVNWQDILVQIASKTKSEKKLPTWFNTKNIIYPSKLSVEQTSSEKTAHYKSTIVNGNSLIDLTGGFGVDDFYFAQVINKVTHCELDSYLSQIVQHNFKILNQNNITFITGDSYDILTQNNQQYDWIYIDPSRRNEKKGKVFMLKDCLPNVPKNLDIYFSFSNKILIKTAPILDITSGLGELCNVKSIHIIAIENEVKELLWELEKNYNSHTTIKTVNYYKNSVQSFDLIMSQAVQYKQYSLPQNFLYEPNAAIMKSGAFETIPKVFNIQKLHQHSHLYTANEVINFPGRVFKIVHYFEYTKNEMKHFLENTQSNISTRNFPETVEIIKKKWKIKDGGNQYTFFTTNLNNDKIVLICDKI